MLALPDYKKPDALPFLLDVFIQFVRYTEWKFLLILVTGMFLLNFLILRIHDNCFLHQENF